MTSATLKFNPNHEPAGSPEGGQFGSGGGESSGTSKPVRVNIGTVYRGGGMRDEELRGGQYYALDQQTAMQYGEVSQHTLQPQAIINLHDDLLARSIIRDNFAADVEHYRIIHREYQFMLHVALFFIHSNYTIDDGNSAR